MMRMLPAQKEMPSFSMDGHTYQQPRICSTKYARFFFVLFSNLVKCGQKKKDKLFLGTPELLQKTQRKRKAHTAID